jgi:hypothetical protein
VVFSGKNGRLKTAFFKGMSLPSVHKSVKNNSVDIPVSHYRAAKIIFWYKKEKAKKAVFNMIEDKDHSVLAKKLRK